ncbi:hypothetical protein ACHWQZ_G005655 [Mnemiopsis leidyi]
MKLTIIFALFAMFAVVTFCQEDAAEKTAEGESAGEGESNEDGAETQEGDNSNAGNDDAAETEDGAETDDGSGALPKTVGLLVTLPIVVRLF